MTNYRIVITAVDRATATAKKINESMSRVTAPFREIGNSVKNLGREVGVEKIGKDLRDIGSHAVGAARKLGSMVPAMAAVTGVASIAGVIELAKAWAQVGRNVTYSSQNIGMSATRLQAWQGAAKLAGLSGEGMANSLQSLGQTMEDAQFGRNQQALMLFSRLGIGLKRQADGQWDVGGEMKAIADQIAKRKNPQQQKLIADAFGVGQMLPFLRKGSKGIEEYQRTAQGLGAVLSDQDVQRADQFALSLSKLSLAGDGLKNSIGSALIPAVQPLVGELTDWIAKNRELIATDIAGYARDFGTWVKSVDWKQVGKDVTDFLQGIGKLVNMLGGWKNAAIGVAVAMNSGLLISLVSLTWNLGRVGLLLGGVILKFGRMAIAARAAGAAAAASSAATAEAAAAGGASAGAAAAGGATASAATGVSLMTKAGVVGTTLALRGDTGTDARDAQQLQHAAVQGDRDAAFKLARIQLSHWWGSAPTDAEINKRARSLMAGDLGGDDSAYKAKAQNAMQLLQGMGWTQNQAAGLAAGFGRESGFNPASFGDNGAAYGIGQWHKDRQEDFARWAGHSIVGSSLEEQLRFANFELTQGNERRAGDMLHNTSTAAQAGAVASQFYERPADVRGEAAARAALANQLSVQPWQHSAPTPMEPALSGAPTGPAGPAGADGSNGVDGKRGPAGADAPRDQLAAPAGPYTSGVAKPVDGNVHVEIEMKNAPAGTKAKATPSGNTSASVRIGNSQVGAMA